MYTNVNQIIYAAANVCFLYIKKPYILSFLNFHSTMMQSFILFCNFVKFQDQSFHILKGTQMNLYYSFIQY